MDSNHPLAGLRDSEITDDHLNELTQEQYDEYVFWKIQKNLDYMVNEGMVDTWIDPDTGERYYKLADPIEEVNLD